jgi:putative superfamily III holin-X
MTAHEEDLRDRPVGDLVKQLAGQTSTLVRQEIDLAKAEMSQKASTAGKGAGLLGGAAVVGLLAAGSLTACLILALGEVIPDWLAALIVALVMGAVAAVLAIQGRNRIRAATPPVPEQTVETVKEDVEWAKTRTSSART